ncbi:hypothetical protein E4U58_005004 [Claviceps cyperi]|nr:hypothetical protein E4U58_005004 [Claviceps cyperi]
MAPKAPKAPKKYKRVPINAAERLGLRQHHAKYPRLKQAELATYCYHANSTWCCGGAGSMPDQWSCDRTRDALRSLEI